MQSSKWMLQMWMLLLWCLLAVRVQSQAPVRQARAVVQRDFPQLARGPRNEGRPRAVYDKCSHPFHSWQCSQNRPQASAVFPAVVQPPTVPPPPPPTIPTTTPKPREGGGLFPDTAPSDGGLIDSLPFPQPTTPPPQTTTPYDKCSHPFHSWQCRKAPRPRTTTTPAPKEGKDLFPEASFNDGTDSFADALPQPATASPPPTTPKAYDKCSHPFHSWLCRAAPRPRTTPRPPPPPPPPTTTTNAPFGSGVFPEASNQQPGSQLFPEALPAPQTTPAPPPSTTPFDICNNPFTAWMCQKPTKKPPPPPTTTTEKPFASGSLLDAEPASRPKAQFQGSVNLAQPQTTMKPKWEDTDPCFHAFHSWLCKPPRKRPTPSTTPPSQGKALAPVASFQEPDSILFPDNTLTSPTTPPPPPPTTTTTTTTTPPPPLTTPPAAGGILDAEPQGITEVSEPQPEPEPTLDDICNHPFHSFLCQKTKPRKPWSNSSPTAATTPPPPPPPQPVDEEPAASFLASDSQPNPQEGRDDFADPLPAPTTSPRYDKCNHPFHSWLCQGAPGGSRLTATNNLPNIQNLPLEEIRSQRTQANSKAKSFNSASNSNIRGFNRVGTPSFIPTVPPIPEFDASIPTVPTVQTINSGRGNSQFIPTVPTIPPLNSGRGASRFIPTVPTVPTSTPIIPTVPTVPGVPLDIFSGFNLGAGSAPIPSFSLPNNLPIPHTKDEKVYGDHLTVPDEYFYPNNYPAIFISSPESDTDLILHKELLSPMTLPASTPPPKNPSLPSHLYEPSHRLPPGFPRPTLPPIPSTSPKSNLFESEKLNSIPLINKTPNTNQSLDHQENSLLKSTGISSINTNISSTTLIPPSIGSHPNPFFVTEPPTLSPHISERFSTNLSDVADQEGTTSLPHKPMSISLKAVTSSLQSPNAASSSSLQNHKSFTLSTTAAPFKSSILSTDFTPTTTASTTTEKTVLITSTPQPKKKSIKSAFDPLNTSSHTISHDTKISRLPLTSLSHLSSGFTFQTPKSSLPILSHPFPPPPPPPPPHTADLPPPPPPPPPVPPLSTQSRGLKQSRRTAQRARGSKPFQQRRFQPPPVPQVPSLPSQGIVSVTKREPLVASGSSHSVVTLRLPEHHIPFDVMSWESQRIVPRKRTCLELPAISCTAPRVSDDELDILWFDMA